MHNTSNNTMNNMNKRRPGNNASGQNRHNNNHTNNNNNRPRRFVSNNRSGEEDNANIARTRRNAVQSREKYQNMARDAMSMGDRVLAENYLQHADHYFRVLLALPPEEVRQPHPPRNNHRHNNALEESGQVENPASLSENNDTGSMPEVDTSSMLPSFITQPVAKVAMNESLPE